MKPKIAIVVLNWKKPQLTTDTIDSLLQITNKTFSYKIYLVDNGSDDESLSVFHNRYSKNNKVIILDTGENLGYVGGNNFGIKKALKDKQDYILLINNDVFVQKDFISHLLTFLENNKDFGIAGPKIYFAPGFEFHKDRYTSEEIGKVIWSAGGKMDWNNIIGSNIGVDEVDNGQYDLTNTGIDFISGCCLMVRSSVFKKIGLLDDKYFMYLEDTDFCQKAFRSGIKMAYIPKSVIWHINAGSSSSGGSLHDYFITRNRMIFGFRFARLRTKFALFRESVRILLSNSVWKKTAIIDFYKKNFGKGSWK